MTENFQDKYTDWQAPRFEMTGEYRASWISELIQNGDRWLRGQKSIQHINEDVRLLMGDNQTNRVESNSLQIDVRTFVETISDLKMIATLGTNCDPLRNYVKTYNDVLRYVYWDSQFVAKTRKALQYAMLGRGYLWLKVSRDKYGWGKQRNVFDPLGPLEVLPEQLPADNDIQGCYAVTIIRPMPIAESHARFPQFQDQLQPISRYDWKAYGTLSMARRLDFWDRWRFGETGNDGWESRYCQNQYTYIRDMRINRTGRPLQMGTTGSTWGYVVPSIGDLIVSTNPFNGLPESRYASEEDCRVYPHLRLIITNPTVMTPMYDGPAFDWHGEMPVVQYDVNDWVWSPMGYSLVHQVAGLEKASRRLLSRINEVTEINLDPPMGHDLHSGVKREQIDKMDLLHSQGYRVGVVGDPKKALVSLLPEGMQVTEKDFKQLEVLAEARKNSMGLNDITSLRDLKMNLSQESVDKILENLGPIGKGIANNIGQANGKLANMLKFNIPQYNTVGDLANMVGPEGVAIETFDNDPNSLVPSHLPGETEDADSRFEKRQRAEWMAQRLEVTSTPEQLLNVTEMQERMTYMLFLQRGAKISTGTIMGKLGVQNYGGPKGDTEYDSWRLEQMDELNFKIKAQILAQQTMAEAGILPPGAPPGPGQGQGGGRPPVGTAPPTMAMKGGKGGDPRVVVKQSK